MDIIKKLKKPYNKVKESYYNCPICSGQLYNVENDFSYHVLGGNTIHHCENEILHKFWSNRKRDTLYLNIEPSETNFDYEKEYELVNNVWIEK